MKARPMFAMTLLAVLVLPLAFRGDVEAAPTQIVIESRFLEFSQPAFSESLSAYPYLQFDTSGGLKFKTGKKLRLGNETIRGIQMKAKQDNALGFVSLGRRFSAIDPLEFSATYQLSSMKGIRTGSTIGVEFDAPFVPVGAQPGNFLFVGAAYEPGGMRGFASLNGTNVGEFPFFPEATSLDIRAQFLPGVVSVDIKPTDVGDWSNLVSNLAFDRVESLGVGVGMSGVDKGAKAVVGGIEISGPSIWADPVLTSLLNDVGEIREHLADAHTAMTRETAGGEPDPDIPGAEGHLQLAEILRAKLSGDLDDAQNGGDLPPDTPYAAMAKKLAKAQRKLTPVLEDIPALGDLFRSKDMKRVRKAETLIFVTATILTVGDE